MNGCGKRVRHAVNGDLRFGHRLEQRRLGLGRGPVDLVGQQQLGEDRARTKDQFTGTQRHRPGQVGGEHVGSELGSAEIEAEGAGGSIGEQGLGGTGNAFEEDVTAHYHRHQQCVDGRDLTDHHFPDLSVDMIPQFFHRCSSGPRQLGQAVIEPQQGLRIMPRPPRRLSIGTVPAPERGHGRGGLTRPNLGGRGEP